MNFSRPQLCMTRIFATSTTYVKHKTKVLIRPTPPRQPNSTGYSTSNLHLQSIQFTMLPPYQTTHSTPAAGRGTTPDDPPPDDPPAYHPQPEMHPLMAAAHHNGTKSSLCRLPDAILIRLMRHHCDPVATECLRRTSRVFLALFHEAFAKNEAQFFSTQHIERLPWPTSNIPFLVFSSKERDTFLSLLARDAYCRNCLAARGRADWEARVAHLTKRYLHCVGCGVDRPACLFSAAERKKGEGTGMVVTGEEGGMMCIGHQGHVRLCQHVVVKWDRLVAEAEQRLRRDPDAAGRRVVTKLASCGLDHGSGGDNDDGGSVRSRTRTLENNSGTCRGLTKGIRDAFRRGYRPLSPSSYPPSTTPPSNNSKFPPQHKTGDHISCKCQPSHQPTMTCRFGVSPADAHTGTMIVTLCWSGHMALAKGVRGRYNAGAFQRGVEGLYHQQGRFICPQISPGRVIGAGLCDPCRCDCIEYPGQSCVWKRAPPQWRTTATCHVNRRAGLGRGDPAMHRGLRISHPGLFGKDQCYSQYLEDQGSVGCFLRGYKADVMACNTSLGRVAVNYMSTMAIDLDKNDQQLLGPMNWEWYRALDPDSLDLTGDDEGVGVYWCGNKGCSNYYRFSQSRLSHLLKPEDCLRPCP